jgi:hypothetical protein
MVHRLALPLVLIWVVAIAAIQSARSSTVALWLFDDPAGSSIAIDSSGNGRDLTLGAGAAIVGAGRFGNALDADAGPPEAIGAYRDRVDDALNPGNHSWTLECWAQSKPGWSADNRIWAIAATNYIDFGRPIDPKKGLNVANIFLPAGGQWGRPTGTIDDGGWHHIAVVYDQPAGTLSHFFDGQRKYQTSIAEWRAVPFDPKLPAIFPPQYPQLQVGWRDAIQQWGSAELHGIAGPPRRFHGRIDEMRFSDEALYQDDFKPPTSLAKPFLRVVPRRISLVADRAKRFSPAAELGASISISSAQGSIPWTLQCDQPWVRTSLSRGSASRDAGRVGISVDAAALSPGQRQAVLRITPKNGAQEPVDVEVKLAIPPDGAVRELDGRRQLFIDRQLIERDENVVLTVNAPEKVELDFPAQREGPLYPSNVIQLSGSNKWRMYYNALGRGNSLRFVESEDGLKWTAPSSDNAVVYGPDKLPIAMGGIMCDELDVPDRRFKAFSEKPGTAPPNERGIFAFYSGDGIHFSAAGRVLPFPAEGLVNAYFDARISKYVAYFRVENVTQGMKNMQGTQILIRPDGSADSVSPDRENAPGYENVRAIGRIETDDLLKPWPYDRAAPPTVYTTASNLPMVLHADAADGFVDFYAAAPWIYPYAQDVYLAFPAAFRHFHSSRQPMFYRYDDANGPIEVQLATSRDGIRWDRLKKGAYLSTGTTNQPDRWLNMMGTAAVKSGDFLYQYYWSPARLHDSLLLRPGLELKNSDGGRLFAARQRLDGFISADVDDRGGSLSTPPVRFAGNRLLLNHNCNATGTIYVELRDLNDVPIPGYSLADCEEVTGNDTGWEVRWRNTGGDVGPLAGKPVKLYFSLRNAKLYAFQFKSGNAHARGVSPKD